VFKIKGHLHIYSTNVSTAESMWGLLVGDYGKSCEDLNVNYMYN